MGYAMPRMIFRFAIPAVVFLLIVVTMIIPLGKSAYNSIFGEKVTVEYKAKVASIDGDRATIEWHEDKVAIPAEGDTYVSQEAIIDLNKYKHVKLGDTLTVAVTEPGLFKKLGTKNQRTIEVTDHELNLFKYLWRVLFG